MDACNTNKTPIKLDESIKQKRSYKLYCDDGFWCGVDFFTGDLLEFTARFTDYQDAMEVCNDWVKNGIVRWRGQPILRACDED